MVKVRHIPDPVRGAFGQPERIRYGDDDRIVFDEIDWRRHLTNDDGHIFQAAHDKKIKCSFTHPQMKIRAGKGDYQHDRDWYSTVAMRVRLKVEVADMNQLPFEERQKIMWKEDFILEFERLEQLYPETVTRGEDKLKEAIARVDLTIKERYSKIDDNGRRKYGGRTKLTFDPVGPKAFLEWVNMYVDADRDPLVLRSCKYKSGNHDDRMDDDQISLIRKYSQKFLSRNKPNPHGLRKLMKAEIEEILNPARKKAGQPPIAVPSYGRLKKEIEEMDWFEKELGREGPDKAMRNARAYGEGIQDVLRPLQHVEIDHWSVGLRTVLVKGGIWPKLNRASRRRLLKVRMVLGVAICRRTHCVLALTLSRTPSVESVLRLIEMAVSDKKRFADAAGCITPYDIHGIMEMLFMDGGPAFNNSEVRTVLRDLKVDFEIAPGGLPHMRGMVERMFRKLDDQVISWFEGRTFSDVVAKGDYDPDARTGTSVDELGRVLVRFIVDRHHNTPLKELAGEMPRECYKRLTKEFGVCPPPDSHKLRNVFGIDVKRFLGPGGIRFLNIQYRSRALHDHFLKVGNAQVECRVHPANLGAISVKIGKTWLTVKAPPEFDRVDAETWIAAEAAMRAKMAHTEKTISGPIINAAILDIERTAEIGRKRAQIDDNPLGRKALLAAEAKMRIFAEFRDELDENAPAPSTDIYQSAIPVVGAPPARRVKPAKPAAASRKASKDSGARKPAKTRARPTAASKGTRATKKPRPGLKRGWSAKD
jgi:putative transposase